MRYMLNFKSCCVFYASLFLLSNSYAKDTPPACAAATLFVEKTICSHPQLNKLQQQLQQELTTARDISHVPDTLLYMTQQAWLSMRNRCKNTACIKQQYQNRLSELKRYNVMDQQFVAHYVRMRQGMPDPALAVVEIHSLDEKRIRVIASSFTPPTQLSRTQKVSFSGYSNHQKTTWVHDLDSQCKLKIKKKIGKQNKYTLDILQKNAFCGNRSLRFSGHYVQLD